MPNYFDDDDDFFGESKSKGRSDSFDFGASDEKDPFSFTDDEGSWGGATSTPKADSDGLPKPPKWAWIAVAAVAALILGGMGVSSFLGNRQVATPVPSASASPSESKSESPSPTPSPTETEEVDPYAQPKNFEAFIEEMSASTVNVECGTAGGTGWAIDLDDTVEVRGVTSIITNHHVIEECTGGSQVYVNRLGSDEWLYADLIDWDIDSDVALLEVSAIIPTLPPADYETAPKVGHWVMAIGSPGSALGVLEGAVTTGNITNIQDMWIVSDTTINPGNSGGPLINAWGHVVGTNTSIDISENVSNVFYAGNAQYMCSFFVECP